MQQKNLFFVLFLLVIAACRLQHLYNFAPVLAMAFFGGVAFRSRWMGYAFPLLAILLSDIALAATNTDHTFTEYLVTGEFLFNYAIYAACTFIGIRISSRVNVASVAGGMVTSVLFFYIVSNFEVWASGKVGYPYTFDGLMLSYANALPFLAPQFIGNAIAAALLFGGYYAVQNSKANQTA